jgi:hypothetical protein
MIFRLRRIFLARARKILRDWESFRGSGPVARPGTASGHAWRQRQSLAGQRLALPH